MFVPPLNEAYGIPWGVSDMNKLDLGTYKSGSRYPIPDSFPCIYNPDAFTGFIKISIMF
jgi:hypothetical protein